uniref:FHA domain containing protein n=1 Tax=Babesia bovis TaxID=5865 RepID=S6B911_BABBO|nr:FHA domain containing protein [Babesia bovis]
MSNHHNVVDDSMGTSADEQSQRSFVQYDHQNPLSMEFGESVSTFVRSGVPTNYSDSRGLSLGDASHVNGSYLPGEVYFPSFNGSRSEDITPQSPYGHVVDAPSPNSAADGILSLRLILNTPASNHDMNTSSRDHILTNLRYSNHVTSTNRIIPQHDPQCFTPMTRSLGLLESSVTEDSARHGYYLPDNAFMSVDVPRDIAVPEMATNGFQSRRVAASPVTDGSRGMWRCVTVSPASSIHTPK